ncbi:MAG TPA: ABC transporter ATP-binding protein [Verrucomicrobiae bacterium]|jgi:spermidine/putrescine transport system ATP-binding protein|nr:ABC transporter ATP-binding protein [Verrucomicrobiae bacterium]
MIDGSDGTPEIRLTDLTKHFRDVRAVDRISMDIRSGEFFSMLGPSGCGKTTTLRMIGGFELPTAGRIELRGRDVTTDPPDKRPVNMVFQNYALFPHLDVHENIAFGLRRKGLGKADTKVRVGEALDLVHLGGYDKRKPNQLSGGQQQRVALARALVNRPNVLLLDEPLGALDLKLRKALQVELKRVQAEVGITFVYVTHDQEEALTMSDRIAVMRGGKVEQLGTPEELYERPQTRFVADFIGTSNLLSGIVEAIDGRFAIVRLSSGETCFTTAAGDGVAVGRPIDLSVRPESVALDARNGAAPTEEVGSIPGSVEQVAYLGGSIQYLVRSAGGLSITAQAPKAGERIPVGGAVHVTWSPGDALVLAEHPIAQEEIQA